MSDYRRTCSITGLPLTAGTPVRIFVLAVPHLQEGGCHLYVPLTPGIRARIGSGGHDVRNVELSQGFKGSCAHFFPASQGHEADLLEDKEQPGTLLQDVFSGQMVKCGQNLEFLREDVYQAVLKFSHYEAASRETVKADLEKFRQSLLKEAERRRELRETDTEPHHLPTDSLMLIFHQRPAFFEQAATKPCRDLLVSMLEGKPAVDEKAVDLAMELLEFNRFNVALHRLGIWWQPSMDKAGESEPYHLQRDFSLAILGICKREIGAERAPPARKSSKQKAHKK
jgi:hypothetical protein